MPSRTPAPHPAGLLYLCMKHVTDRYNMYYSYAPTKLNEQIHMTAVYQAIFAPLLGLFWMLFFSVLRLGGYQAHRPSCPRPLPASAGGPRQHLCSGQAEKARDEQACSRLQPPGTGLQASIRGWTSVPADLCSRGEGADQRGPDGVHLG